MEQIKLKHVRMKSFFENLTNQEKGVAIWSGLLGWFHGLTLLNAATFWEYALRGLGGLVSSGVTIILGLVANDFYKYIKPKTVKFFTSQINKIKKWHQN